MRLNKETQNALLMCLYLSRAGRAPVSSIAEGLSVSVPFLSRIANHLRLQGILVSIRGVDGGFELENPNVTVRQVLLAMGVDYFFSQAESEKYMFGSVEERALHGYFDDFRRNFTTWMTIPFHALLEDQLNYEMNLLNQNPTTETN